MRLEGRKAGATRGWQELTRAIPAVTLREMARVRFLPLERTVECKEGDSIFEVAQRNGIPIPTACVAKATCGLCRVKIVEGEAELSPLNRAEEKHLGNTYFITKLRLSCQARLGRPEASVTVQLPDMPARKISPP
jgi:2Fe-2S ferredoxin